MTESIRLPEGVTVFERGWLSSNNVVFASGRTAVVDTGYVTHLPQTLALVRNALGGRALELIVNTHLHSDHCGGNAGLQAAYPDARTRIPAGLADAVRSWDEDALSYAPTSQSCARFRFDDVMRPGTELELGERAWQVHAAPGHDPHSVVLFEPELEGVSAFHEVAATLDVIERLNPEIVIPGHGRVFGGADGVASALTQARRRLEGLMKDPARHAGHAVKVLIKFKLLEWQSICVDDLLAWAAAMQYVQLVHGRFFSSVPVAEWLEHLLTELERSGALTRRDGILCNI